MTKSYLTLKDYPEIGGAKKNDVILMAEDSAKELGMEKLTKYFKLLTEEEAEKLNPSKAQ